MFVVWVADNFHYMDESEVHKAGEFPTWADAVAEARRIVDSCLTYAYRPGMSAAELYKGYVDFGDDPYIDPSPPGEKFSAWEYAKERCEAMCAAGDTRETP